MQRLKALSYQLFLGWHYHSAVPVGKDFLYETVRRARPRNAANRFNCCVLKHMLQVETKHPCGHVAPPAHLLDSSVTTQGHLRAKPSNTRPWLKIIVSNEQKFLGHYWRVCSRAVCASNPCTARPGSRSTSKGKVALISRSPGHHEIPKLRLPMKFYASPEPSAEMTMDRSAEASFCERNTMLSGLTSCQVWAHVSKIEAWQPSASPTSQDLRPWCLNLARQNQVGLHAILLMQQDTGRPAQHVASNRPDILLLLPGWRPPRRRSPQLGLAEYIRKSSALSHTAHRETHLCSP